MAQKATEMVMLATWCTLTAASSNVQARNSTIECGKNTSCSIQHSSCCSQHGDSKCNSTHGQLCEDNIIGGLEVLSWRFVISWMLPSLFFGIASVIIYVIYRRQEMRQRLVALNQPDNIGQAPQRTIRDAEENRPQSPQQFESNLFPQEPLQTQAPSMQMQLQGSKNPGAQQAQL